MELDVVKIYAALVIAIMIIPPIVLSFIVTRYRGDTHAMNLIWI